MILNLEHLWSYGREIYIKLEIQGAIMEDKLSPITLPYKRHKKGTFYGGGLKDYHFSFQLPIPRFQHILIQISL